MGVRWNVVCIMWDELGVGGVLLMLKVVWIGSVVL